MIPNVWFHPLLNLLNRDSWGVLDIIYLKELPEIWLPLSKPKSFLSLQYHQKNHPMTDPWCCYIWCAMDPINKNPSHVIALIYQHHCSHQKNHVLRCSSHINVGFCHINWWVSVPVPIKSRGKPRWKPAGPTVLERHCSLGGGAVMF